MLIAQPASPLNEPEDGDDEEDGDSEGDDDDYSEKLIMTIRVLGLLIVNANRPTQLTSTTNAHRPITSLYCCGF